MLLAVVEATVLARVLGTPSIYSARIVAGAGTGADGDSSDAHDPPDHAHQAEEAAGREFAEVVQPSPRW
jgi:hypothetical protein